MGVSGMKRLTFMEQMSRNRDFRGRDLAIVVRGPKGFESRAAEALKNLPALLTVKGFEVKCYTPLGVELNAAALIGRSGADIDAMAAEIDALSQVAAGRKSLVVIPETINIPAGSFKMGSKEFDNEKPIRTVSISQFAMGKYEVTNAEYKAYLEATGQEIPEKVANPGYANHPVVDVAWNDAVSYCKWLSEQTGRAFRLPTEAEWEYAARGVKGLEFPYGNKFDASKVTYNTDGTMPVNAHPEGASPFGVEDMTGNVWEWTAGWYGEYDPKQTQNPKGPDSGDYRVLRGGSWNINNPAYLRGANRGYIHPEIRYYNIGFRLAEDLK